MKRILLLILCGALTVAKTVGQTTYGSPTITASGDQSITTTTTNVTSSYTLTGASLNSITWSKFSVPGQAKKKIGVLGSSTSEGNGASNGDSSYVGRLLNYYRGAGIIDSVINLALSGYNVYQAMPTGYVPPVAVTNKLSPQDMPDVNRNITALLQRRPDVVIVNFPTNGYDVLSLSEIMSPFQTIYDICKAQGVECYITTTQPRTDFFPATQSFLQVIRDSLLNRFGSRAINFYDGVTVPGTTQQMPQYAYGDGIHLNNAGHLQLFNLVVGTNIFKNLISSPAVISTPSATNTSLTNLPQGVNKFQVTVMDSHKQAASAVTSITVNAPTVPVANAAPSQSTITLPTDSVVLDGSASAGPITSYLWTKLIGGAATIVSPSAKTTTVKGLVQGTYIFQLSLNNGASVANDTVTVKPAPPPVANAGPNQSITLPTNSVVLDGSASTGTITSFSWTKLSGGAATITSPSAKITTVTGLVQGTYIFQLSLNNGASVANDTVTVKPAPPPVANAGPSQSITLPVDSVMLDGSASTGTITSYMWTKLIGGAATIVSPSAKITTVTGLVQGTYIFQLSVNNGASVANDTVTVKPAVPPVAKVGPNQSITLPVDSVMLDGSASTGPITSYLWTKLIGGAATIVSPSAKTTTVKGMVQGTYIFQLSVNNGASVANDTVTVKAPPPVANAGSNQSITLPTDSVVLDGSASTGPITSYLWTKLMGGAATIVSPSAKTTTVKGMVQGTYIFQLSVNNGVSVANDTVTVRPAATGIGNQNIDQFPVDGWGNFTYGLTWLPLSYAANPTKRYPLILFLHGGPEADTGISGLKTLIDTALPLRIARGFIPSAVNPVDGKTYEFLVVSPQSPNWSYTYDQVQFILPNVLSRYRIDSTRIYLTGEGAGGDGAWTCVAADSVFAKQFAAMAVASAVGVDPLYTTGVTPEQQLANMRYISKNWGVKIWSVVGDQGYYAPVSMQFTDSVNSSDPPVPAKLTILSGVGHSAWNQMYDPAFRPIQNYYGKNSSVQPSAPNTNGSPVRGVGPDSLNVYEWFLKYTRQNTRAAAPVTLALSTPRALAGRAEGDDTIAATGFIKVYPNPAVQNRVTVYARNKAMGKVKISLLDMSGKLVQENVFDKEDVFFQEQLDMGTISKGVYFLKIQFSGKDKPFIFKMLKE